MLNLKGKHIEFSINQLKQPERRSSSKSDNLAETISGGFVEFNTAISKKDTLQQTTTLSHS